MIWLSSYPRSGNTFFRNVLVEVYGLESSSFYDNVGLPENYTDYPFVKTHMLPHELVPKDKSIPAVHLVRDGRDAIVSMAHQQIEIYNSDNSFRQIIREAIEAAEGSYFGGWSQNVLDWLDRSTMVVRFEELIVDPITQVDRINSFFPLPPKNEDNLPTFEALKHGQPKYGRGKRLAKDEQEEIDIIKKSFRRGKAFGWRDELDRDLQNLFWSYHRNTMERLGYERTGGLAILNPDMDYQVMRLLGHDLPKPDEQYKILIEANKLLMHQNDGVKRYLLELLKALHPVTLNENSRWRIDVFQKGKVYPLKEFGYRLFDSKKNEDHDSYSRVAHAIAIAKSSVKWMVPEKHRDAIKQPVKKVVMKAGLKLTRMIAAASYLKERLTSGKEAAKENYELQLGGVKTGKYDLIHVPLPQHFEPFVGTQNNQYMVTVHDITHQLFSEYHTSNNVQKAEKGFLFFKEQNADFLCISEATKQDLLDGFEVDEAHTHVVYEAADNTKFRPVINKNENATTFLRNGYGIPDAPFLLTLSTLEPRKNLLNTIKAFDLLLDECPEIDANLVIGGKNGWKSRELLQLKHKKRIIFTGFISEHDLPTLYNEAEALCYVSHYEGFGLPPLEAMSCKTPVIFGDNSSMKELFTGYGLGADSNDVESIKNQMKVLLTDADLKAELGEKSLERTFDFSWRKTAIETLNAYEKAILNRKK